MEKSETVREVEWLKGGGNKLGILEIIAIVLVVLWLGGFTLHIAGGLIHLLLIVALVLFLMRFFKRAA